jgi:hypothetical protein
MVSGAAVARAGAIPLSDESLHPPGQFLNSLHELGVVGRLANAREGRPGDGLGYTVREAGRSVELNIRLGGEGGLNVPR